MSLRSERTKWVMFLPCSLQSAEQRHVMDLVYGVYCLESAGISPQDIFIYIDSPNQNCDGFLILLQPIHTFPDQHLIFLWI